jgi:O-acetyl-ADP-ribose deacetylase (regulator of RNase III)
MRDEIDQLARRMCAWTVVPDEVASRMRTVRGDITRLHVDAIVNAADNRLLGGGGVDGAIHAAAGPELLEECRRIGGCPTGEARITGGYRLPARHVIHTVGPVYRQGMDGESDLLRSCYHASLALAAEVGVETIAFPCISAGIYGYPKAEACEIAVSAVNDWLREHAHPREVVFCCFDAEDARLYEEKLGG